MRTRAYYGRNQTGIFNEVDLRKLDYMLELRKSYHVYILSNTNPFVMSWACSPEFSSRKKPLNDYCDKLYLSYQVGHTKEYVKVALKTGENLQNQLVDVQIDNHSQIIH